MRIILAGIETEYGLAIEGRGASDQLDDAATLVRGYPGECLPIWDYRNESPRADLRGFKLEKLLTDPEDEKFDIGRLRRRESDIRSDRILPNGARFYNDHGHPEYSTPECLGLRDLASHDLAGELVVLSAAKAYSLKSGLKVRIFKNNTDFHGASYGTHENYLVPRALAFDNLFAAVMPMLVARQVLCGAGKVGSESGPWCDFQISQRADFFAEVVNAETLYRRPIFNTRDEPHADPSRFIRLHVISGDANRIPACIMRKVGLVKLAIALAEIGEAPRWRIQDPVRAFQTLSRDASLDFCIELEGRSWTTAFEVLESYFAASETRLRLDDELAAMIGECRVLMEAIHTDPTTFRRSVDWAVKRSMLQQFIDSEGCSWKDPTLQALDLEYHHVDPETSLYNALLDMGEVADHIQREDIVRRIDCAGNGTRADARGFAVRRFPNAVVGASWASLTLIDGTETREIYLDPERIYGPELEEVASVGQFIECIGAKQ